MMLISTVLTALFVGFVAAQSDSEVVAVFLLGRHGDRTSKIEGIGIEGSSVLTTLGKNQIYDVASYFRNYYLEPSSPNYVQNFSDNLVLSQIYASAPNDNVLGLSAQAFLQGLYPASTSANQQTLANGTTESAPLNGYQYVLLNGIPADAPESIQIAGDQNCPVMTAASKAYYNSTKFLTMQNQTQAFYNKFQPLISSDFTPNQIGFQSAFNIFDYLNVGYTHNSTIMSNLSTDDLFQLRTLADSQSFDLVYNASSPNVSIGGKTLANLVLSHLNQTAAQTSPNLKVTYVAGAYGVMQAFWGLSNLTAASPNFYGLPDYASTMAFELRRPVNTTGFNNLSVRFGFRNGSLPSTELTYFPMFGQSGLDMAWSDWSSRMANISISSTGDWCTACNSNQTFCTGSGKTAGSTTAGTATGSGSSAGGTRSSDTSSSSGSGSGLSNAAAGGIGAAVTIGVIALIEGALALCYFNRRRPFSGRSEKVLSETGSQ